MFEEIVSISMHGHRSRWTDIKIFFTKPGNLTCEYVCVLLHGKQDRPREIIASTCVINSITTIENRTARIVYDVDLIQVLSRPTTHNPLISSL
jgi:hypothetical protein